MDDEVVLLPPEDELECPITLEIMKDPVTCADGHTYDRSAIEAWFRSGKTTSPWTNEEMTTFELVSNKVVKRKIAVWNGSS